MAKRRQRNGTEVRQGRRAETCCAVCGKPLTLWDRTTALDGATVCADNCLGVGILRARELPEYQDAASPPVQLPNGDVMITHAHYGQLIGRDLTPEDMPGADGERSGSWFDDIPE